MPTLSKLKKMKDADIQKWLRRVGRANALPLGMALLGADEDVRQCVFRNMSPTAAATLAANLKQYQQTAIPAQTIAQHAADLEKWL